MNLATCHPKAGRESVSSASALGSGIEVRATRASVAEVLSTRAESRTTAAG